MAQSLANPNFLAVPAGRRAAMRAAGWGARRWHAHAGRPGIGRIAVEAAVLAIASALTVWSAVAVKQGGRGPALMALSTAVTAGDRALADRSAAVIDPARLAKAPTTGVEDTDGGSGGGSTPEAAAISRALEGDLANAHDARIRWFNGRPIRPAHVVWMTVTAYTPGAESCWPSDDGQTATLHCVTTNGGAMVAADTSVLPFGSLVSVEGYDASRVVPVLDRGGKIRGQRLDVLMETVEEARAWGVRRVPVVVWEYADGQGPTDPRRVR